MRKIFLKVIWLTIVLGGLFMIIGCATLNQRVNKEVGEFINTTGKIEPEKITAKDIKDLPEPVQKYLRYTQIIGTEKINFVRLKQKGFFRQKPDQDWAPLEAEEYYTTHPPGFIWHGKIKANHFLSVKARDKYHGGEGNMLIKLWGLITVADAKGDEMDQGALVRYLNEIMWFPTAYLNDYIEWEPIDSNSAKVTMSYEGVTASAVVYFNEKGEMTNFVAKRYMSVDDKLICLGDMGNTNL
jgi:hypothetical protein